MDNDDVEVGRRLTRREAIQLLVGGTAGILWVQPALASPAPTPEQTEGPYFVEEKLKRKDIKTDPKDGKAKTGIPLVLALQVFTLQQKRSIPLAGATVDIWHCDASGVYSDVEEAVGHKFLRGYQVTDVNGRVEFATIYPGAYSGRAVHIHFKVRHQKAGKAYEFTSQLYFDETVNDKIFKSPLYAKSGKRTRNSDDGIYAEGGKDLMLKLSPSAKGYLGSFQIGLS
jgi:protocatechuate 3,4-dioxygenase beta subunit